MMQTRFSSYRGEMDQVVKAYREAGGRGVTHANLHDQFWLIPCSIESEGVAFKL
jgi:hypothetical protein